MSTQIPSSRTVLTLHGDGSFRRMEMDMPELGPGMVLIKAKASLVSPGTELKGPVTRGSKSAGGWRGLRELQLNPDESLKPKPFGYANAGIVTAVGPEVHGLKEGDRVASVGAGYAQHSDFSIPFNL